MSKVAIIGTGFIGRAWAITFARAGHAVTLWDQIRPRRKAPSDYIAGICPSSPANDLLDGQPPDAVLARIRHERDPRRGARRRRSTSRRTRRRSSR